MPNKSDKIQKGAAKKASTIKKRQEAQKKKLLEILEESPNLGVALSRVGINRSTLSRWRYNDPNFSINVANSLKLGIEKTADNVEMALLASARDGNVGAQKYFLSHNHERYKPSRHEEISPENALTEERKKEIAFAIKNWSRPIKENQRDEDYESPDATEDEDSDEKEDTTSDKELK